ncbi:MAG: cytochrome C [SAR86 cluster bacterium]|uniref:Cytochrome C n=1 Tax=SAR86 cluster bacterium TaxID=2030880 RepID=A0A2A5AWH5_9GAMM|nr:MAG: cytochrome C [SAR86 cluster bacterium]
MALVQFNFNALSQEQVVRLGTPISESQLEDFDLIISPDGDGLPAGSGTALQGKTIYETRCVACHAISGEGTSGNTRLVGGDMHSEGNPIRTVGSYWPYASTLFDFIRRAMPADSPKSLSNTEVYQVTAYVLYLNGIINQYAILNSETLTEINMPNKDGFIDRSQVQ